MQELLQSMRTTKLFGYLSEQQLISLLERNEIRSAATGDILVRPDEQMQDHLVLVEGEIEIQRTWMAPGDYDKSYTWTLTPRDAEEGLAYLSAASCCLRVRALTDVRYILIDGHGLDEMLGWSQQLSQMEIDTLLQQRKDLVKQGSIFHHLPLENMQAVLERLTHVDVTAGETVISQGEVGDRYYIIQHGEAEIWKTDPSTDETTHMATISSGDAFGEEALLQDGLRNATVKMTTPGRLLVLGKEDFDELVKPGMVEEIEPETALDMTKKGAKWIDCRYDTEYDETRIPDARHIPLDQLRRRIPELDADSEYVVYSNSGPRSKAAAFLLRERNIKAKSLIGGIRNWQYETFVRFKKKFEETFGEWVIKHRWWIIIATILAVVGIGAGMRLLTFNNDNRVFFSEKNPQLKALEALENTYTKNNIVLFVIAPKNRNVFTRKTLAAVEELTEASWKMPYSSRVDSISNFQHTRAEEDDLIVEDLVQSAESLSDEDIKRINKIALSEPLLVNRQISPSGHVTGVSVNFLLPGKSMGEVPEVATAARKIAGDLHKKYPGIDIYLTGGIMVDNAFGEASREDMSKLVPAMYMVLLIIIGLSLRSVTGTISTLLVIVFSMITGLGMAGWLGISLNPATVNAPTIILTLAVADSVHILTIMFHQMRLGKTKHEAITESIRVNLQPVFLTSATTAIGFLTMNFSDAPPFRDLGNTVAIGVMAAFLYSALLLPALMAVLPVRPKLKADKTYSPASNRFANFVIDRRKLVFWGTLVAIVVITSGILRIELDDNFIKYFDKSYDFRRASDFTMDNLTGLNVIEYSLESGETGGISNPEYLTMVEKFANWYRKQPKIVHVDSISETMKRLNKNMHGDDKSFYRIPEQRDLAAQYLLLYEMSLPFGLDLNNQINVDKSAIRMTVTVGDMTSRELREIDEKARGWLKANAPKRMFTYGSGMPIMFAHISERNINSMLGASFGALVLISAILIFALRSFKLGVLSLIPNLIPAFMAFGVWGMIVGRVGLGLSVIVSLTIGIVVDDTVHFMSKYLRARREYDMNPVNAVRYSFNTVGTAMLITTIALVAGFMILAFSGYKMSSDMGQMTAITIVFALALDFLFLPTLLIKWEEKTDEKIAFDFDHVPAPAAAGSGG